MFDASVDLAKRFEGFHRIVQVKPFPLAGPYLCPALFWTIGYGHLCEKDHPPITQETAELYLRYDLNKAYSQTLAAFPGLAREPEGRQVALVDFTFNLGIGRFRSSTLLKRVKAGRWQEVPTELRKWVWGGGRKLPGLIARREAEIALL